VRRTILFLILLIAAGFAGCGRAAEEAPVVLTPGAAIKDCPECPALTVVPAGTFLMGSPVGEKYRGAETQHQVTFAKPFAIGTYEVTFAEWDACVADGGCGGFKPGDEGWGRGNRPVINVNAENAKAYVEWLSRKTGKRYRLPSEAEWEYAARAGTKTAFAFGDTLTDKQANFDASSSGGVNRMQTMPVGSYPPNAFGLHDMHGNAWEWVADCWNDEYTAAAPADGSAWRSGGCKGQVLRGGSWEDYSGDVRSAARVASGIEEGTWSDGFRVARDL
jgi:formylglycine-generating enzyme required for sulfatase activity